MNGKLHEGSEILWRKPNWAKKTFLTPKYQFKYYVGDKAKFVYSWRLEPTDKLPAGTKATPSLRELEKQIGRDIESQLDPQKLNLTVVEITKRYLSTKTGSRPSTAANYNFVMNILKNEEFGAKKISHIKTSDAKLFLIKLQKDGRGYSTVKTVRGILRAYASRYRFTEKSAEYRPLIAADFGQHLPY